MSYRNWKDVYDEVLKKHDEDRLTTWKHDYKGVQSVPPAIEVGDKVRVCKARWAAEGYPETEQRYLKEGVVVSIERTLGWYSDRQETHYIIHFDFGLYHDPVLLKISYKEIYSHKPKGVNFTYMLNRNSSVEVPKTEVDESPFIYPDMDIASWYPKSMAASGLDLDGDLVCIRANPTLLSALDWDGDEPNVIRRVDKMETSEDGVKIYISQPPRCGKDLLDKFQKTADRTLGFKFDSFLKKHPIIPDEIKTIKNGDTTMKTVDLRVKNIIHNGPCTIVFWMDNTKTIVKLKPGDTYDPHAAFCIAVAKKMYGNNSKISKIVDQFSKDVSVPEMPTRDLTIEELKAAADKLGYRVARKPKKK